jgi:hypothetical protein
LSCLALADYAALLVPTGSRPDASFDSIARAVCGEALAQALLEDLDLFQVQGLAKIDRDVRAQLIQKYRRFESKGYAREIVAWLNDEYRFDPNCLTE